MNKQKMIRASYSLFASFLFTGTAMLLLCACFKKQETMFGNTFTTVDTNTKKWLALGDSYTIGTSVTEAERYPVQATALLKEQGIAIGNPEIIATNGWTTGDLLNAVKEYPVSKDYNMVSLLIGVNNQYQGKTLEEYKTQFSQLLKRSIELADGKPEHVIVLSIPDYSVTPFAAYSDKKKIAAEIDVFNNANKTISTDMHVRYIDVTVDSRMAANDRSLVASDGLHFSGKEYAVWAKKILGEAVEILK